MSADGERVLITIPISHYCERARWALDRAGIAYRERAHVQLIHWVAVKRAGGESTVPVLVTAGRVFADSADIVDYADESAPEGRGLYPPDQELANEIRDFERELSDSFGPSGRLWMYHGLHDRRDLALAYGCTGVPAWERTLLRLGFPVIIRGIDRFLGIDAEAAAAAHKDVVDTFDRVATRLADGQRYLFADSFTAADLTFAALAAPALVPPEYGVPLPQPDELPGAMGQTVREFREHPAGRHAMRMFREERR
jgi:glutathione S-transferase